jgi:hypothetical protein
MPLTLHSQLDTFDLRNVDWKEWRYKHARMDELKEVEKQKQESKTRSTAALLSWHERKNKDHATNKT